MLHSDVLSIANNKNSMSKENLPCYSAEGGLSLPYKLGEVHLLLFSDLEQETHHQVLALNKTVHYSILASPTTLLRNSEYILKTTTLHMSTLRSFGPRVNNSLLNVGINYCNILKLQTTTLDIMITHTKKQTKNIVTAVKIIERVKQDTKDKRH